MVPWFHGALMQTGWAYIFPTRAPALLPGPAIVTKIDMVPPTNREKHAPSGEIIRCAARRLLSTTARLRDQDDDGSSVDTSSQKLWVDLEQRVASKIWRAVALVIGTSLLSAARGVRIESLGTFALDAKGRARFFLAPEFAARHRLLKYDVCSGGSLAGGSVNTRLNIARVAAAAGSSRPMVERVVDAVLHSIRQRLAAGRSVTLSFHPVAEFSCNPGGIAGMRYLPGFRSKQNEACAAASQARLGVGRANSKASPWSVARVENGVGGTAETFSPRVVERENENAGDERRPRSALEFMTKSHRATSNRPGTVRGSGRSAAASTPPACIKASLAGSVDNTAKVRRHAWGSSGSDVRQHTAGVPRPASTATTSVSRTSLGPQHSPRPGGSLCGLSPDRAYSKDELPGRVGRPDVLDSGGGRARQGRGHSPVRAGVAWLVGLLRSQTTAQVGEEGCRRLTETLKLMHVGRCRGESQVSGRDLLDALRDVGTKLSSDDLTKVVGLFQRQPDGHLPLQLLIQAMEHGFGRTTSEKRPAPVAVTAVPRPCETSFWMSDSPRLSPSSRSVKGKGDYSLEGSSTPPDGLGGGQVPRPKHSYSSPESRPANRTTMIAPAKYEFPHGPPKPEERGEPDGYRSTMSWRHREEEGEKRVIVEDLTLEYAGRAQNAEVAVPSTRQECRSDSLSGRDQSRTSAAPARDAIGELAGIVYTTPCSLEGLIHVLQASKVIERPTIACAALSARLLQLRPGLGKAKAGELAAAACRYPEKEVDLGQLHALLERRFGRGNGRSLPAGSASRGSTTVVSSTARVGKQLSCAAIERVRRNLIVGKGGLRGLGAALSNASGSGEGSLTKDELKRALISVGGRESLPPTAKDLDDMFTLFSSQTSAGVGGGKAEVATVLRGLRGDLTPCREKAVRDVFRRLSKFSSGGSTRIVAGDSVGITGHRHGDGGGDDGGGRIDNANIGGRVRDYRENTDVSAEQLKEACCGESDDGVPRPLLSGTEKRQSGARGGRAANNGVTEEQFLEYYRDVSAGVDGDDAFEAVLRGSWSLDRRLNCGGNDGDIGAADERGQRGHKTVEGGMAAESSPALFCKDGTNPATNGARYETGHGASFRTLSSVAGGEIDECMSVHDGRPTRAAVDDDKTVSRSTRSMASAAGGAVSGANRSPQATARRRESMARAATGPAWAKQNRDYSSSALVTLRASGNGANGSKGSQGGLTASRPRRPSGSDDEEDDDDGGFLGRPEHASNHLAGKKQHRQRSGSLEKQMFEPTNLSRQTKHSSGTKTARASPLGGRPNPPPKSEPEIAGLTNRKKEDTHRRCTHGPNKQRDDLQKTPPNAAHRSGDKNREGLSALGGNSMSAPPGRPAAAVRVQRVFRGHRDRKKAAAEARKRERRRRAAETDAQANREGLRTSSRRLLRPKLPSTYGF